MTFQSFLNTHISVAEHLLASNGGNNTVRQPHTLYPALCSSSLISLLFVLFIRNGLFLYILFYTTPISYLLLYGKHFRCSPRHCYAQALYVRKPNIQGKFDVMVSCRRAALGARRYDHGIWDNDSWVVAQTFVLMGTST